MVDVKICGVKDKKALDACLKHGATMVGVMLIEASPRYVDLKKAAALHAQMRGSGTQSVAVVMNPSDAVIDQIRTAFTPDCWQLHGQETVARVAEIRQKTGGASVIKALSFSKREQLADIDAYQQVGARLLLDAPPPAGSGALPGGNGVAFDWSLAREIPETIDWILSGGLHAENLAQAVQKTGAGTVDVSSGVESAPGVKDPKKIEAFLKLAKK